MELEEIQERMMKGMDCGQLVAMNFADEMGLEIPAAQQLASAFGGGMYSGETCGAVCGALLALGAHYGFHEPFSRADKAAVHDKTLAFLNRFKELHGSITCRDLLGHDLSTPDGMAAIREKGLMQTVCPRCVYDAIEIVEELFDED
ncbi:MAG: C-GCAxxG-C-C family protein [Oscillospiraceae bacterium]|nr:C-GCAxxG-C-C family protein [Oscillospiraceae bacterium]